MIDIFKLRNTDRLTQEKHKLNVEIPKPNQATFRTKTLMSYGPKIWDALPYHIKCWDGKHFTCRVCEHVYIVYFCIYFIFLYKSVINTNCISIDDPFLLNKKDSQGVILIMTLKLN